MMGDEADQQRGRWPADGAPGPPRPAPASTVNPETRTEVLGPGASTATFPTVFGAGVTMTSVGDASGGARTSDPLGTRSADALVGRLLDGRYRITQRLARGGMATVYQAVDTRLTRTVAVKIMHIGLGDDEEFARKFDREARAAARLSHPNVVSVFDQGQDATDGHTTRPYIVMEYVDGDTLRDVITREAPLTPLRALEVIEPVLAALASAHDAGLVHRDVKPENVLISLRNQIKVADFGLAKAISSQTQTATQGLLIGTVSYLPPELVVSGRSDARSDVYSAGIVLFELLTGCKPHTGETPIQVAYAHVHHDVPAPSSFRTAGPIPPYLDALLARATARDPDRRPHDARVLLTQVRRVRAALREGRLDDPELTQDLSSVPSAPAPRVRDRADFEATQLVPSAPTTPTRAAPIYAPPTVVDAPPPVVAQPTGRTGSSEVAAPSKPREQRGHPDPGARSQARARQARKRRRGWLALLLVLLLTTGALLAGWYLTEGRFTTAPALGSLSQAEAEQTAGQSDLRVNFETSYSESVDKGMVIRTDPAAGVKIIKGGEIDAVVSKGPERYAMPTVVGSSQAAAGEALTKANLSLGQLTKRYSESVAEGIVTKAAKKPGASLKRGSKINLTVSAGPEPIKIVDYTGQNAAKAVAALKKAGFTVVQAQANSEQVAAGLVISQDPGSGSGHRGDTVTVTSSLGPPLVMVPNVVRMRVQEAEQVMAAAGVKTEVKPAAVNYIGIGWVVSSQPGARAQAPKGSTITLIVV